MNHEVTEFIYNNIKGRLPNLYPENSSCGLRGYTQAAKQLGIAVKQDGRMRYFYAGGKEIGSTVGLRPSLVSKAAWRVCANKLETLRILEEKGVQQKSFIFSSPPERFDSFYDSWLSFDSPSEIAVKPAHGQGGCGITIGVTDKESLELAYEKAIAGSVKKGEVIVEKFFSGLDVRVIVVNGEAVCSTVRLPPYIIGDGKHSAADLVAIKNKLRLIHPHHKRYPVSPSLISNDQQAMTPSHGEVMVLSPIANIHQGGEAVDFTDHTPASALKLAESAVLAIDGLGCAGVDLMINRHGECKVLEINVAQNFGIHYYPMFGEPRNPANQVLLEMLRRSST